MKHALSTPALTAILVLSAGFVFPIIFSITDRLLRELFSAFDPTLLMIASFSWLLVLYFFGIKFSLEYINRQFEIADKDKLFTYSNIVFAAIAVLFYASLVSTSLLSNILWGGFYLCTIGFFYILSSKELLKQNESI